MKETVNIALLFFVIFSFAQENKSSEYTTIYDIEATNVKDQGNAGTCWSFSTTSFIETEIFRKKGILVDISEIYSVRNTYERKAMNYILRQGKTQFGQGSLAHDVINSIQENGLVLENTYTGGITNQGAHNHSKVYAVLDSLVKSYVKTPKQKTSWPVAVNKVLDTFFGKEPSTFVYNNKEYSPKSFQQEMKIDPNDYITITSYDHHPFYKKFILEIPDNFSSGAMYNLPLDEYIKVIDYALSKGYSMVLDVDISEKSFLPTEGIALLPVDDVIISTKNSDVTNHIQKEIAVTQKNRQEAFYNYDTTDDHLMHITGLLKDRYGNKFYKVKNSWGIEGLGNNGYVYISVPYIKMKSISILLHKDGIPKEITDKLKI